MVIYLTAKILISFCKTLTFNMNIWVRYSELFLKNNITKPDWSVSYYDDCDKNHEINRLRGVELYYSINTPNNYHIRWAAFDKLLALEVIDIELTNAITCTDIHKLDYFMYEGVIYKSVDEVLITKLLNSTTVCGYFVGTAETIS